VIALATGLVLRRGRVLLVASRYASHAEPLWNLPGGRQKPGELLSETVVREVFEETGLRVRVKELAYMSESYDGAEHFINATFLVSLQKSTSAPARFDRDHIVEVAWVPVTEIAKRIVVGVVRKPLLAYLRGAVRLRFAGFHEAGVTIEWPADSE
jgi:ADP-ribose pyrophosphatase YjhB (NUDIX family)